MKASVHLVSLGCAKNLVDSEVMLGTLLKAGHAVQPQASDADVIIVNTCGFLESSRQESIDAILEAGRLRKTRPEQKIVVAGCMAQRFAGELQKEIPEVSAFIGINEVPRIHEIIETVSGEPSAVSRQPQAPPRPSQISAPPPLKSEISNLKSFVSRKPTYLYDFASPRYQLTPAHYAWLKIGEGCNHPCAFCSIPIMRGRHRSRTIADVEAEARALVANGVKELLLISQDTTYFGRDLGVADGLSLLLERLNAIEGDFWIRILYTHPAHWSERLMKTIAACPKVCRYMDMPLQHIEDAMLMRMRRETSRAHIENILVRSREIVPDLALRTTFIVGFPGETDGQFETLLAFVKQAAFERLGVFEYSQESGTLAGKMENQVPSKTRKERRRRLMAAQQKVSEKLMAARIGKTLRVLVDATGKGARGRSDADAPDIDGRVLLRGKGWRQGEFQPAKITGATKYDLVGETS